MGRVPSLLDASFPETSFEGHLDRRENEIANFDNAASTQIAEPAKMAELLNKTAGPLQHYPQTERAAMRLQSSLRST